jgi:predicted membrane chloride channel (bestrophin family)
MASNPNLKSNVDAPTKKEDEPIRPFSARAKEYGSAMARRLVYRDPVKDAMTYHTADLSSWNSLVFVTFTVWNRRSLWITAAKLLCLSIVVCFFTLVWLEDPAALKVSRFAKISSFLRVFVGLLLGFFMSASVKRWWACVEAFLALCGVCRKLQMALNACGVSDEHKHRILHYAVVSVWILHHELHVQALSEEEQEIANQQGWAAIASGENIHEEWQSGDDRRFTSLSKEEISTLQSMSDPAGTLWVWIGAYVGNLAKDGAIKTLAPPSFSRCMALSGEGLDKILKIRSTITVQAPYIYVQMLASLVHLNNIINALSFGLTAGSSVGTWLAYHHWNIFQKKAEATGEQAMVDMQALLISFFFSCFGPFIYQALLEVSIAIAQPFSNEDAVVPTKRMLKALVQDLHDGFVPVFPPLGTAPPVLAAASMFVEGDAEADDDDAGP